MSCHYPSCMMGGGNCPYKSECERADREAYDRAEERRLLDLAEQKARIERLNAETALMVKAKMKLDLEQFGDS